MWQPEWDSSITESHISWSPYRYQVPLYPGYGTLGSNKAPTYRYRWTCRWHLEEALGKGTIIEFPRMTWCHWETRLWGLCMMNILSSMSSKGAQDTSWSDMQPQGDSWSLGGLLCTGWKIQPYPVTPRGDCEEGWIVLLWVKMISYPMAKVGYDC